MTKKAITKLDDPTFRGADLTTSACAIAARSVAVLIKAGISKEQAIEYLALTFNTVETIFKKPNSRSARSFDAHLNRCLKEVKAIDHQNASHGKYARSA